MIKLASHNDCTGCSACYASCGRGAISMVADAEGFLQPVIDEVKCVNCGFCVKSCPVLAKLQPRVPLAVYAAKAKDDELRLKSSSGGVFSLLARAVIAEGGIVFGAGFDCDDWHVMHKSAETEEELGDLRGSKYVHSELDDVFKQVKCELFKNRKVLFSGTPCQIAGIRLFLGRPYDNLLLVDVVCHAAPSPLAWRKYLEKRVSCAYNDRVGEIKDILKISFRCKSFGWKRFSLLLRFSNNNEYLNDLTRDTFLRGFHSEFYNRKSCHNCHCRELKSGSDLTIADYWRVHEKLPEMDDDKGTALILVNTDQGQNYWHNIENSLNVACSDFEDAIRINPAIKKSPLPHRNRARFFKALRKGKDFDGMVLKFLLPSLRDRVRACVKRILKRFVFR